MDFSVINWWAVAACVVAAMVIGSIWFSPKVFYPAWWKAIGKSEADMMSGDQSKGGMGMTWFMVVVSAVVQAIFMNLMVNAMGSMTGGATLASGATAGFFLWLGFVAPSSLTNKLFADRVKAWYYEAGNHLVTFVVMGAIAGALG